MITPRDVLSLESILERIVQQVMNFLVSSY